MFDWQPQRTGPWFWVALVVLLGAVGAWIVDAVFGGTALRVVASVLTVVSSLLMAVAAYKGQHPWIA